MIEYVLLFGLGFLSAVLAALLVAPAIHRRIVILTERRLKATMPISPAEVRAQKDFVRAEMAVEVARTGQSLAEYRHKAATQQILNDQLTEQAGRLHGENSDLKLAAEELSHEMAGMRASLATEQARYESLRLDNARLRQEDRSKAERIDALNAKIRLLLTDVDNARIDLATRETEIDSLKARINALRDERDQLRAELKATGQRAKDAELKLAREENKTQRLEERMEREMTQAADRDTALERRQSEINRLKERLKAADGDLKERDRLLKKAGIARPPRTRVEASDDATSVGMPVPAAKPATTRSEPEPVQPQPSILLRPAPMSDEEAGAMADDVRNQTAALSDRLINSISSAQDDKIRAEIADVAAKMIALTAHAEGMTSPILPIISGKQAKAGAARQGLAERATRMMARETDS